MTEKKTANTEFIVVMHSRKEMKATIESAKNFDLTNYTFLGMHKDTSVPKEEWVWTEDIELWRGLNVEPDTTVSYETWLDAILTSRMNPFLSPPSRFDIQGVRYLSPIIETYSELPVCLYKNKAYAMMSRKLVDLAEMMEYYQSREQKIIMYQMAFTPCFPVYNGCPILSVERAAEDTLLHDYTNPPTMQKEYWIARYAVVGDTLCDGGRND